MKGFVLSFATHLTADIPAQELVDVARVVLSRGQPLPDPSSAGPGAPDVQDDARRLLQPELTGSWCVGRRGQSGPDASKTRDQGPERVVSGAPV